MDKSVHNGSAPDRTILVVDDSRHVRQMVRYALADTGYRILEAADGQEALKLFMNDQVDLVITDLIMPEMDGYELIRDIRSRNGAEDLPIIVLSSEKSDVSRERAREAGVSAFVAKPFKPEQVHGLVREIFI